MTRESKGTLVPLLEGTTGQGIPARGAGKGKAQFLPGSLQKEHSLLTP